MIWALDIETTGLDSFTDKVLVIGVYNPSEGYKAFTVEEFKEWHGKSNEYVLHNGGFDCIFLLRNGVDIRPSFAYDTRSIASIAIPSPELGIGQKSHLSLENLCTTWLGVSSWKLDRNRMSDYSIDELTKYNEEDCRLTYQLFEHLFNKLPERSWQFVESWIMPATRLCMNLEYNGIYGDWAGLEGYKKELEIIRARIYEELQELTKLPREHQKQLKIKELENAYNTKKTLAINKAKDPKKRAAFYDKLFKAAANKVEAFNWSSPLQVAWLFRDYYGLNITNDRTGKETTDDEMLKSLDHPVAKKLLEFREVEKLLTQQIPGLLDNVKSDGCIHGRFMVGGTRTGRLSSSQPNLQQISSRKPMGRRIRSFIRARPGYTLATIDYSQIEPRLLAHYSQEPKLIQPFKEGIDIYSVFAKEIFGMEDVDLKTFKKDYPTERACGKTGGLSVIYGTSGKKFAEMVRKETGKEIAVKQAYDLVNNFRNRLEAVADFKLHLEKSLMNRKVQYNLLGRPIVINDNSDLYMLALNTLIQGSASDLVVYSQFELVLPALKRIGINHTHRLLVHDETLLELPESEAEDIIKELVEPLMTDKIMERLGIDVPLKVEYGIGRSWAKP